MDLGGFDGAHELAAAAFGADVGGLEAAGLARTDEAHGGDAEGARVALAEVRVAELELAPLGTTDVAPAGVIGGDVVDTLPRAFGLRRGPAAKGGGARPPHGKDERRAGKHGRLFAHDRSEERRVGKGVRLRG